MLAPLGMVFAFGAVANRTSAAGAQLFFYAFAGLMGLSLSAIFIFYTTFSIIQTSSKEGSECDRNADYHLPKGIYYKKNVKTEEGGGNAESSVLSVDDVG